MKAKGIINGFSKLSKEEKLEMVSEFFLHPESAARELMSFWHSDPKKQSLFEEFSENTISNFYFPYSHGKRQGLRHI